MSLLVFCFILTNTNRQKAIVMKPNPIVLIILDGWGSGEPSAINAITSAKTPTWNKLLATCPNTTLSASGLDVGLPNHQMGNSEVGHLTIGAGRVILQDLTRISQAIENGSFDQNPILTDVLQKIANTPRSLHILGLLSPGGVHSHEEHIHALVRLAANKKVANIFIHAILDGRDTPPESAKASLQALQKVCHALPSSSHARIASLCGRYYAMDRDQRYERTQRFYECLTEGNAPWFYTSATEALIAAYARGETDEFVTPTILSPMAPIVDQDAVIFMNFRSDRARQLSYALSDPNFTGFARTVRPTLSAFATLTEYASTLPAKVIFPPEPLHNMLGEYYESNRMRQLRMAETEKYAHVTFFLNGGREQPFEGEDRILVPSPKVATYDLSPKMSAVELTEQLVTAIQKKSHEVIICNYANADMVGHTGNFQATVAAIETLDACLEKVITALQTVGGEAVITADHGNAEMMFDDTTHQPHTAHTTRRVPFVYVGRPATITETTGTLRDVAPTLLALQGLTKPTEMTGNALLQLK